MKRLLSILLIIGIAAFALVGCDQDEATADGSANTTVAASDPSTPAETQQGDTSVDTQPADASADGVNDPIDVVTTAAAEDTSADRSRGPISILGDADFTAANGVVGGTGTEEDPYMIAGWSIVVPSGQAYGVRIENVTANFTLRGLIIQGASARDGAGIRIGFAPRGTIEGCSVTNSLNGIDIVSSTDISMENCLFYTSGRGLRVVGEAAEQYRHQISTSNLYNDRPIYYYYGLDGETITGLEAGHLTVANSRNVTISHNDIVNGDGLLLAFVEDSMVTLNVFHRTAAVITEHGLHLYNSTGNEVYNNFATNNRLAGIQLTLSDNNRIHENFLQSNDSGIRLLASNGNEVLGNQIFSTVTAIALLGASSDNVIAENALFDDRDNMKNAISVDLAYTNSIRRNLIYGSDIGISLEVQASGNTVEDNTIVAGGYGVSLSGSNNTIARNLFSQFSRAILFPETFQASVTRGNTFRGNVLSENANHVYTNMDSAQNRFTENVFLNGGRDLVNDQGDGNLWTVDGIGNFWGFGSVVDANGDGIGDEPVVVYPSESEDTAPLATVDATRLGLGVIGTMDLGTATIENDAGDRIDVAAFIADDPVERLTGFRGFPTELIAGFPGILFVMDEEVESQFVMDTVPVDLDIVFFNAEGDMVGAATMTAQATMLYQASAPYQYALELPSGSLETLGIGADSKLILP